MFLFLFSKWQIESFLQVQNIPVYHLDFYRKSIFSNKTFLIGYFQLLGVVDRIFRNIKNVGGL